MPGPENFQYKSGRGKTSAFLISSNPWITGSSVIPSGSFTVNFPKVSKSFTVINSYTLNGKLEPTLTGSLVVYFGTSPSASWDGINIYQISKNHYVELADVNDAFTFDVRTTKVHITCMGYNGLPSTDADYQTSEASGSFLIVADLSNVDVGDDIELSGSGIDT